MDIHYDNPSHAADFVALNEAWIREHFVLEAPDRALARDPMRIVREGGTIITASEDNAVVGACALVKEGDGRYQLARMAVDAAHRGRGLGSTMVVTALARARAMGAASVYLLSNRRLAPALHLYRKHGFREVREGAEEFYARYARCDIVMELILDPGSGNGGTA